jgi:hypothetical protein
MKKPMSLKVAIFLLGVQVLLALFVCVVAQVAAIAPATSGFWFGFEGSLANQAGLDSPNQFDSYHVGLIWGTYFFPLLTCLGAISFIFRRKQIAVLVCLLLNILIGCSNHGFPLFGLISLILIYLPGANRYFKNSPDAMPPPFRG